METSTLRKRKSKTYPIGNILAATCSSNQVEMVGIPKIAMLVIKNNRSKHANRINKFENKVVNRIFPRFKIKK